MSNRYLWGFVRSDVDGTAIMPSVFVIQHSQPSNATVNWILNGQYTRKFKKISKFMQLQLRSRNTIN